MGDGALDIVGLGLATLDVLVRVQELPTWERMGAMSGFALDGGGPVGTGLVAAARLGARVGYVGTAGTDRTAELKLEFLAREGLDLSRLVRRPGPEGNVILVCVDEATGERTFTGLRDRHRTPLSPEELDRAYLTGARYLHLDGHHPEAALAAARWMHAAGREVLLDGARVHGPGGRVSDALAALVREVDILICGSGFVPALTERDDIWEGRAALDRPAHRRPDRGRRRGLHRLAEGSFTRRPCRGRGGHHRRRDVFHGAYLVGPLHGWDLPEVTPASAVSALKCGHPGAAPIDVRPALEFLADRGVLSRGSRCPRLHRTASAGPRPAGAPLLTPGCGRRGRAGAFEDLGAPAAVGSTPLDRAAHRAPDATRGSSPRRPASPWR